MGLYGTWSSLSSSPAYKRAGCAHDALLVLKAGKEGTAGSKCGRRQLRVLMTLVPQGDPGVMTCATTWMPRAEPQSSHVTMHCI